MSNQKKEIKDLVVAALGERADQAYFSEGFKRRSGTVRYVRELEGCTQSVEVCLENTPKDNPNAAAAIYPWVYVKVTAVDSLANKMTGHDDSLLSSTSPTLHQPIELVAPKGTGARWFLYQPDSVQAAIAEFVAFSQHWVFPFLHEYSDARNVIAMYRNGDERVVHDQDQFLRVIAAMLHQGDLAAANETLQDKFGRPASRRRFARVFTFVEQNLSGGST